MIRLSRLSFQILLVAVLNVTLLLTAFLVLAESQFGLNLTSFLLTPARFRILSTSRLAALELANQPRNQWNQVLARLESSYPAQFFLFDRDGAQLAGTPIRPPASLFERPFRRLGEGAGAPPDRGPDLPEHLSPEHSREHLGPESAPPTGANLFRRFDRYREPPQLGVMLNHTVDPPAYWAVVRVPILVERGQPAIDARLVWRFDSLWTNSFFIDYKPLILLPLLVIGISFACWFPFIRSLTRSISAMTNATQQIAEGRFDVQVPVHRRDELGRLSDSINRMADRLSGFVNGQRRFLGDIAHELCSPIARIQLSLGILEQRTAASSRSYVETIDDEIQHMSSLVNELLSFSKASLGASASLESVSVLEAVKRAVEREKTESVDIKIHVPEGLAVVAQRDYLFRSISNVLRNAIRYAGGAGPIEISASTFDEVTDISIADQGPGVPAAELEEILRPFYRPEAARQRETGGVGLGLAIVKTCIEACRGSVTCRNRVPRGFEVNLRLPTAAG